MANKVALIVDLIDFDRSTNLPISALFGWAQKCRLPIYFYGPFQQLRNTVGAMMVKAQTFQFDHDATLPSSFSEIHIEQSVASVGKTSITLSVSFTEKSVRFASGIVVMVCVSQGKAREIPQDIAEELLKNHRSSGQEEVKLAVETSLRKIRESTSSTLASVHHEFTHDVLLRSSDEDTNKHVRHLKYAQFFEDTVQEHLSDIPPTFQFLSVEYIKETRRGETCVIRATQQDQDTTVFVMHRGEEIVCRGYAKF